MSNQRGVMVTVSEDFRMVGLPFSLSTFGMESLIQCSKRKDAADELLILQKTPTCMHAYVSMTASVWKYWYGICLVNKLCSSAMQC